MTEEPIGCRPAGIAILIFVAFAAIALSAGLLIGLDHQSAYPFLFAGLPISGLLTVLGGDLILAWPLDLTLWLTGGFLIARYEQNTARVPRPALLVVAAAVVVGILLAGLVEPTAI